MGERWPVIRAVMAPEHEPRWAQARGPRKGFGLVQCQKEQLFNYTREALSKRSANLRVDFLVLMTPSWLKGWAVTEFLAPC